MKRALLALALTAAAVPVFASDAHKLVARVNGREITNADIDAIWDRVPAEIQAQYLKNGGKQAFLQNTIAKKLIVQDAVKSGFAAKIGAPADLTPAAESALFDRYVREVVAASIVTEDEMKKVYAEHRSEFNAPEQAHVSIIRALKKDPRKILVSGIFGWPNNPTGARYRYINTPQGVDVAPICQSMGGDAAAGLRLKSFVESFGGSGSFFSICQDDFAPALKQLGEVLATRL